MSAAGGGGMPHADKTGQREGSGKQLSADVFYGNPFKSCSVALVKLQLMVRM